ncbi:succinate-semialdehyde dehydrogenase, mitochondrial-like [Macrosteles quadrilineatus]|uniref:succinate-semialdehyde dehydrogenase, mitochondrial-like n=1 Tax=Macrosteles quadrilineatus TaxID=74068 RepID=UPI0023E173AE|nr:succinate-semialdehyde dehydrogenase, mitochondrial-like [Macrosteles quadrilineatus]
MSEIAAVPDMDGKDVTEAIVAANAVFGNWSRSPSQERAMLLRQWLELLNQNAQEIAEVITLETGKPLAEAIAEVAYGNSFVDMFAAEATRIQGETLTSGDNSKQLVYLRQPIGVVAIITPFNFPYALLLRKTAAALAAGCCCVIKPAEDAPLSALAAASTLQQAGFPKGVYNVVTSSKSNSAAVGKVLCSHPSVAGLSFTGSTEVGKCLYGQCATGVKRVNLELGGDCPFIVFPSADLDHSVSCALYAKFRNCGQACVSPNKFLVHINFFDKFVEQLAWKMKYELNMGSGFAPLTNIGPLINSDQLDKVKRLVDDAVSKGAKVHVGGGPASYMGPLFYEPTLLTNVKPGSAMLSEEIFGPVVVVMPFTTEEEALKLAHNTSYGLAAYMFTQDIQQAWRVAKALDVGMVGVNDPVLSTVQVAFGGVRQSGLGREGSHLGIQEFTFVKTICFGNC